MIPCQIYDIIPDPKEQLNLRVCLEQFLIK